MENYAEPHFGTQKKEVILEIPKSQTAVTRIFYDEKFIKCMKNNVPIQDNLMKRLETYEPKLSAQERLCGSLFNKLDLNSKR